MSSAIVHSYYFTEAGLLAFIEFHSLYNLLIEVYNRMCRYEYEYTYYSWSEIL